MEAKLSFVLLVCLFIATKVDASFFEVRYPSVVVSAETGGNLSIIAGPNGGNIYMVPGDQGTVYIGRTDMLKLFQIVNSMPPIWGQKAPFGRLGMFLGGDMIDIVLTAIDPEGSKLRFEKVSGALPPGVVLDKDTGSLNGTAPDVDATYEFGIRVIDEQGKYADQTFTIDTRERDQCKQNPCKNGGVCVDDFASFTCRCPVQYGGNTCTIQCENEALGVASGSRKISDAQMSGHYAYASSDHEAAEGRLNSVTGWIGEGSSSWLQIDFGKPQTVHAVATQGYSGTYTLSTYGLGCSTDGNSFTTVKNTNGNIDFGRLQTVHAVATQGYSGTYTLSTYGLSCSTDGNSFTTVKSTNGTVLTLSSSGSSYSSVTKEQLPVPVDCRYLRFLPKTWTGSHPGLRVEVYGCKK